jgi:hypothetical protein
MKSESFFIRFTKLAKARVGLRSDGIVQTDVYEEQELSVADVKEIIQAIGLIAEQQMMPQLIIAGPLSGPDIQAMRHLATEGSSPYAIAEAYIITSLSQKILGRFYLNFNKPARPTRIFNEEGPAIAWLQEQARLYHESAGSIT